MNILLTNDDGFDAPGLVALYQAVAPSHTVSVVAPSAQQSSGSHAATLSGSIRVDTIVHPIMGNVFVVDGTPVDCVRLAISKLIKTQIDHVVSGINLGANLSIVDVHGSGTVAAAREAVFSGIGGIAVSQMYRKNHEVDWSLATRITATLLPQLITAFADSTTLWNVNIPASPIGDPPRSVCFAPLSTDHIPMDFAESMTSTRGQRTFEYKGRYADRKVTPNTDISAVLRNQVCVTPLLIDPTDARCFDHSIQLHV